MTPVLMVDAKASLGEGPVWDCLRGELWWVDIDAGEIHATDTDGHDRVVIDIPLVSCVTPARDGRLFFCAGLRSGFLDVERLEITWAADIPPTGAVRFNDGKCDPTGRFWAGTMDKQGRDPIGSLYRFDRGLPREPLSTVTIANNITVSNGLAWSRDGTHMYYIDTPRKTVDAFSIDLVSGVAGERRTVISVDPSDGQPDGMTIDSDGLLWVAHWDGHAVSRYDPQTGTMVARVPIPAARVTSCMFGGKGLSTLFITTARQGASNEELQQYPASGGLFAVRIQDEAGNTVHGLPEPIMW